MKTEYLLNEQVELVLRLLMPQNRLVIRVAIATGLRVGDILALTPDKLSRRFTIKEQKTGKSRRVSIPPALLSDLQKNASGKWVFPGRDPEHHRTRQAVWKDIKRAAVACRFPQNVAPHSFRKVYAVRLLQKYGDIKKVARALNHSSFEVTAIYAFADKWLEIDT